MTETKQQKHTIYYKTKTTEKDQNDQNKVKKHTGQYTVLYIAVVKAVIKYRSETWVMSLLIGKILG